MPESGPRIYEARQQSARAQSRTSHVSGGMFKPPGESHHHPDSQVASMHEASTHMAASASRAAREGFPKLASAMAAKSREYGRAAQQQSGPRGGRYVLLPGGGKKYL